MNYSEYLEYLINFKLERLFLDSFENDFVE